MINVFFMFKYKFFIYNFGSTTNLMENATLVVKRSYVFRTVI